MQEQAQKSVAELKPQPPELEAGDRVLVLTVTDLEDADPGPEAHDVVQAFLDAAAAAVAACVRAGGKVLVCCRAGRNRSVALAALALADLDHGSWDEALLRIKESFRESSSTNIPLPSQLLTSGGGQFFERLLRVPQEGRRKRQRRTQQLDARPRVKYQESQPYRLRVWGTGGGELYLGNFEGAKSAGYSFDVVNLSGKNLHGQAHSGEPITFRRAKMSEATEPHCWVA
jgi:hypothetical protein